MILRSGPPGETGAFLNLSPLTNSLPLFPRSVPPRSTSLSEFRFAVSSVLAQQLYEKALSTTGTGRPVRVSTRVGVRSDDSHPPPRFNRFAPWPLFPPTAEPSRPCASACSKANPSEGKKTQAPPTNTGGVRIIVARPGRPAPRPFPI